MSVATQGNPVSVPNLISPQEVLDVLDEQMADILKSGHEDQEREGLDEFADEDGMGRLTPIAIAKATCFHLMETRRAIEGKPVSFRPDFKLAAGNEKGKRDA